MAVTKATIDRKKGRLERSSFFRFPNYRFPSHHDCEEIDDPHFCAFDDRHDVGVLLKRTGDDHDHNASDYRYRGASAFDDKNAYA